MAPVMHDAVKSPQTLRLFPEKLFYKIGEASTIIGVETYVLRYWESEFSFLRPRKSRSGQRIYTKRDLDLILQIKHLLYEEKYTIDGARKKLSGTIESLPPDLETQEKGGSKTDTGRVVTLVKERLRRLLNSLS